MSFRKVKTHKKHKSKIAVIKKIPKKARKTTGYMQKPDAVSLKKINEV